MQNARRGGDDEAGEASLAYDNRGRISEVTITSQNRKPAKMQLGYDSTNQIDTVTWAGREPIQIAWDAAGKYNITSRHNPSYIEEVAELLERVRGLIGPTGISLGL